MSGIHLADRATAKTRALQRYRDRRSESERALEDLIAEEGWPHERWRRWKKRPRLMLHAPQRVEPVSDDWRATPKLKDMTGQAPYDPTRWRTEDLIKDVRDRPLDP